MPCIWRVVLVSMLALKTERTCRRYFCRVEGLRRRASTVATRLSNTMQSIWPRGEAIRNKLCNQPYRTSRFAIFLNTVRTRTLEYIPSAGSSSPDETLERLEMAPVTARTLHPPS